MQNIICEDRDLLNDHDRLKEVLYRSVKDKIGRLKKVLLITSDITRKHSMSNITANLYYEILKDYCDVDVMPALGTHLPTSDHEREVFFGDTIPKERFLVHNWRKDVVKLGEVPADFVKEASSGVMDEPIDVEVNKCLADGTYDLIISMGQVVPHEIVGMANYSKNIFVGCGGLQMINKTHIIGGINGLENNIGNEMTPVRRIFDYAQEKFLGDIPLIYLLTVTTMEEDETFMEGIFIGEKRDVFEKAVRLSKRKNIYYLEKPVKKVVTFLDEFEFKTTFLGGKAIYRTKSIIEDGGELVIIAPGVVQFGEDDAIDKLIRKYGYCGREELIALIKDEANTDLRNLLCGVTQMILGSTNGRFKAIYAVKHVSKEDMESVYYGYMDYEEAIRKYDPEKLEEGFNTLEDGEEIYFINNPAKGLWQIKS